MLTRLQHIDKSLPVFSVELAREAYIGDSVYHELFVGLSGEGVFSVFWLYFRIESAGRLFSVVLM